MIDALADVKHAVSGSIHTAEREFEEFQRGFVGLCLLRGDDFVEVDAELGTCCGK
jgi:hypothetical protein